MCIQRAFRRVPASGKPLRSFTNVKQQATEPYHHFVDRLKEAVQRQIDNPDAQVELLLRLAYEQSNADCRKILQTIIHRPNYTLADMLQACAEVGTQTHAMALLAGAIRQDCCGLTTHSNPQADPFYLEPSAIIDRPSPFQRRR
ncbi:endogenous retrovirus group K member 21 Gag polyprotein-like isoform X4 [Mauremys mutica]|uniref:endogenous retrovirus group K member 21 Gag polyprotein-like isoform X4 n=1 Tax=Mauremys mutica TaxID=74926 RepID=UPI001D16F773|nr:endogenous retrovirus group K member 21 Gag polyprotein-like isoform X4 [Mauremys mutica]